MLLSDMTVGLPKEANDLLTQLMAQSSTKQSVNPAATYKPNSFTTAQLGQIPYQASPSMLQAYQAKMQGMGVTPQPFTPSVSAPQKGGK